MTADLPHSCATCAHLTAGGTCTNADAEFTADGCAEHVALTDDSDWILAVLSDFPPPRSLTRCQ